MSYDTRMGGAQSAFPGTHWSAIVAARSQDQSERNRGLESIIAAYWKPVYKYLRIRHGKSNEDAKDLTQEFFARLIEKGFLDSYDPGKARLRTFLRVCIDRLVANEAKAAARLKRGAGATAIPFDFDRAEQELMNLGPAEERLQQVDAFFEQEWVRSLFSLAVEQLENECRHNGKSTHFELFRIYDLEGDEGRAAGSQSYRQLARQFGLAETDVTNYLAYARREFRRIVLTKLREMTSGEEEFRREARALLGAEVK